MSISGGQFFRDVWIASVKQYYGGTPEEGYILPWSAMPLWEQESAQAVYDQICQFVLLTDGHTQRLSREQKGRFVCLCWIGQVLRHYEAPKESYVADWEDLPIWQKETDADVFEAIESSIVQEGLQA